MRKRKLVPDTDKQFRAHRKQADDWDKDRYLNIVKSKRIAWIIAIIAVVVALVESFAIAALAPMKEKIPYLLRVDSSTGVVDEMITLYDEKEIQANEQLIRYFSKKYLDNRLGYEYKFAQEFYNTAFYMSEKKVAEEFRAERKSNNPVQKYKDKTKIDIQIKSFELLKDNRVYVRLIKTIQTEGKKPVKTHWIARMSYTYLKGKLPKSVRAITPLGFVVTSFSETQEEL